MTTQEPKLLRRLITADGIKGPIEEVTEPRPSEYRAVKPGISNRYSAYPEFDAAGAEVPLPTARRYSVRRQVPCVLLEMEEEV